MMQKRDASYVKTLRNTGRSKEGFQKSTGSMHKETFETAIMLFLLHPVNIIINTERK